MALLDVPRAREASVHLRRAIIIEYPSQAYMPACALMVGWMEFCLQFILIPSFLLGTAVTFPYPTPILLCHPSSGPFEYCMTHKRCFLGFFCWRMLSVLQPKSSIITNMYYYAGLQILNSVNF